MSIHLYPVLSQDTRHPARLYLLVLAEDLCGEIEIETPGDEPIYHHALRVGDRLDILLLGPTITRPGRYTWRARVPQSPSLDTYATIEVGEQDLRATG